MRAVAVKIVGEFIGHIRSAVSLGKGGTEELHSRSSNERPGRPCQLGALSGRRAAQDGHGRVLGGPERAGAKGPGEVLSAGRAAAPGQFQVETLGRGRSADRVAHELAERAKPAERIGQVEARSCERAGTPYQAMARAVFSAVAAVGLLGSSTFAQTKAVKPTDEGTIEFPLENDTNSGADAVGVNLTLRVEPPSKAGSIEFTGITVKELPGVSLPIPIAKGVTRTLVVHYTIPQGADEGNFEVFLDADIPDQVILPDPASWNTSVLFKPFGLRFSLDRLG